MSAFLKESSGLDTFACGCCNKLFPTIAKHEHHKIKKMSGGQDTVANLVLLCALCHTALHNIEHALRNDKKRMLIPDMLQKLFPDNARARETCLYLASTAALGQDAQNPGNVPIQQTPDYSQWDTDEMVHLTAPMVPHKTRDLVKRVCRDMKHPRTGRTLGVGAYLRLLVEQDLRKRGFNV